MKRPLSRSQIVCIILLWVALCYIVLVYAERIDGYNNTNAYHFGSISIHSRLQIT
ncbi:hypothetical protein NXY31_11035 [Bacteroides salyersiae]|nr:hypothetical protein [Bacteroides salyersiae]